MTAPGAGREARLALQPLQRFGSFLKFLSAKNSCSPAVQMNSVPQSTHVSDLSWNSIGPYLSHSTARTAGVIRSSGSPHDCLANGSFCQLQLIRFAALLLPRPLARERLFGAAPIARFQVERMLLDILDDIFLLNLPLEAAKRAFNGLAFLHFDFSQAVYTPLPASVRIRLYMRPFGSNGIC